MTLGLSKVAGILLAMAHPFLDEACAVFHTTQVLTAVQAGFQLGRAAARCRSLEGDVVDVRVRTDICSGIFFVSAVYVLVRSVLCEWQCAWSAVRAGCGRHALWAFRSALADYATRSQLVLYLAYVAIQFWDLVIDRCACASESVPEVAIPAGSSLVLLLTQACIALMFPAVPPPVALGPE